MEQKYGKISITLLLVTAIFYPLLVLTQIGTAELVNGLLVVGVLGAFITAFISKKGTWKTIGLLISSLIIAIYLLLIVMYWFAF
ncbi:hypothetical protein GLW08_19590 [Pontibacillus yanchengensis]|uniref:Uncharacterized protein n=2 Tax=Pontibacillus yanchengensis TaxID=462910 RepID=A0ACC7VL20_9BACI|nr:hypothetical protein [Pontibacillus yanchengensis]MYL35548.1 hypothetical protein [Pontibacillus yanchengensis]MYL55512.1 hypothetical protein [Pontibacillus yanchengensis]